MICSNADRPRLWKAKHPRICRCNNNNNNNNNNSNTDRLLRDLQQHWLSTAHGENGSMEAGWLQQLESVHGENGSMDIRLHRTYKLANKGRRMHWITTQRLACSESIQDRRSRTEKNTPVAAGISNRWSLTDTTPRNGTTTRNQHGKEVAISTDLAASQHSLSGP